MNRIVQLANFYGPTSGGLRVAMDALRLSYREAGHHVTAMVPGLRAGRHGDLVELPGRRVPGGAGYLMMRSRAAVLAGLDETAPDLIEVHDKLLQHWVWPWAQARGIPVIAFSHERLDATLSKLLPIPPRGARLIGARIARRALSECHRMVVCSDYAATEFAGADRLRRLELGVDLSQFVPDARLAPDSQPRPLRLICVGRLSPEKHPELAIGALSELQRRGVPAELTMVGSGPMSPRLVRESVDLPVRFTGFLDRPAVASELARADLALAPGPAETFCLAALEALASGLPVICAEAAATAELIAGHSGAGRAVQSTAASFADGAMSLRLLPQAERRQAARTVAERYSWQRTGRCMRQIQDEVSAELLGARWQAAVATA